MSIDEIEAKGETLDAERDTERRRAAGRDGARVAMIVDDGVPVELIEFSRKQ